MRRDHSVCFPLSRGKVKNPTTHTTNKPASVKAPPNPIIVWKVCEALIETTTSSESWPKFLSYKMFVKEIVVRANRSPSFCWKLFLWGWKRREEEKGEKPLKLYKRLNQKERDPRQVRPYRTQDRLNKHKPQMIHQSFGSYTFEVKSQNKKKCNNKHNNKHNNSITTSWVGAPKEKKPTNTRNTKVMFLGNMAVPINS